MTAWQLGQIYDSLDSGLWRVTRILSNPVRLLSAEAPARRVPGLVVLWNERLREYAVIGLNEPSDLLRRPGAGPTRREPDP